MKALIKNEIDFLRSLAQTKRIRYFRGSKIQKIILVLLFYLVLDFLIALPLAYFLDLIFPNLEEAYLLDIDLDISGFFLVVIFAPILEELIFRLPLKLSLWRFHFFLLVVALCCFIIHLYFGFAMLIFWAISISLFLSKKYFNFIKHNWLRYRVAIFYSFSFLFGLVHAFNFDPELLPFYAFSIIFLPQLIGGVLLAIIRLRFGFFYALLLHSTFNGILMLVEFFTET